MAFNSNTNGHPAAFWSSEFKREQMLGERNGAIREGTRRGQQSSQHASVFLLFDKKPYYYFFFTLKVVFILLKCIVELKIEEMERGECDW